MTGARPFEAAPLVMPSVAPECVPEEDKQHWLDIMARRLKYDAMLTTHEAWVSAILSQMWLQNLTYLTVLMAYLAPVVTHPAPFVTYLAVVAIFLAAVVTYLAII